jgi:hypothetical protein
MLIADNRAKHRHRKADATLPACVGKVQLAGQVNAGYASRPFVDRERGGGRAWALALVDCAPVT